jgi:ABC transporter with metal-binding/Fe-S-binding domain ATP-binding protein
MRACLFSGGKDSTLAVHRMHEDNRDVELLLTAFSKNEYSYMFHTPNIMLSSMQAEALGIRQATFSTEGVKDDELIDLESALKDYGVTELVTGAVASNYQKERIDAICGRLGISHVSPLWHIEPLEELQEISMNYDAIITQVSAEGFDDAMLGARIGAEIIDRLVELNRRYGINMLFEGGEAETFVLDAPLFKKRLEVVSYHKEWSGMTGRYVIDKLRFAEK